MPNDHPGTPMPALTPLETRMLKGILGDLASRIKHVPGSQYAFTSCDLVLDVHAGMDKAFVLLYYKIEDMRALKETNRDASDDETTSGELLDSEVDA